MPNGFAGSKEDWERLEALLRPLDRSLQDFARQHGLRIGYNEHSWPSRSLHWRGEFERVIQISLETPRDLLWNVWVYAWQDRYRKRYWKKAALLRAVPMAEIEPALFQVLRQGMLLADTWSSQDLEFATDLPT